MLELSTFEYGCLVELHINERKGQRRGKGVTEEQHLSDKPPLTQYGETFSIWL